jgi:outer membrane receptor for ferrienterochelin and colicins
MRMRHVLLVCAAETLAHAEVTDVEELSLADLLDTKVDVASKTPQSTRETPGIVSVITRDDIVSSGARDLIDVLIQVPGFAPAVDVEGVVDLGIRGLWGHEGKILLLIDGQPMNELLYSTLQLANHYPLEAIERIEVIRGPGSAIYGGFAELSVINIITRDAASLEGVAVAGSYGQLGSAIGHAGLTLTFGTEHTGIDDLKVAGSVGIGHATSRGTYRDFEGNSYAMDGNSGRQPMLAKVAIDYGRLRIDTMIDNYSMRIRDGIGPAMDAPVRQGFRSYYVDARYKQPLPGHLTLEPHLGYIRQSPWAVRNEQSELYYDKTVSRYTAGASLAYDPSPRVNVRAGVEALADRAHLNGEVVTGLQTLFGESRAIAYDTIATYAQGILTTKVANVTVGARYEHHSAAGGSLVPRIALTKVAGPVHAKLLAAQAFRAPGIENLNLGNAAIEPERTTVFEAELGMTLGEHMYVGVNAYDITINKPIIYGVDPGDGEEHYFNAERTGTRGFELDYRVKYPRGRGSVNYSYYTAGKNQVESYMVPDHDGALLAFPSHKVAASGSVDVIGGLSVNPSAVIYGQRFGYTTGDADGNPMVGRVAPTALVNLFVLYRIPAVPGLELGAGVYDIAAQHYDYLQPYSGGHPPLPGTGREAVVRVAYERKL